MMLIFVFSMVLQTPAPTTPVRVFIHASRPTDGFIPPDQNDRDDSVRDLQRAMRFELASNLLGNPKRKMMALVKSVTDADLVIDIVGRTAEGDMRYVRAQLVMGDLKVPIEGTDDDADWSDAAKDLAKDITAWVTNNFARIPRKP